MTDSFSAGGVQFEGVSYPGLHPDDLRPMTPDEIAWVRAQRITEEDPEPCKNQKAADEGRCAYAGDDGKSACGVQCRLGGKALGE